MKKIFFVCILIMIIKISVICEAHDWDPVSAGPGTTWTAPLCGKGKFVFQPFFFYNHTRGSFDADGDYHALPRGDRKFQYQEQFFMQYGLTEKWEIDAQAVYQENYQHTNDNSAHTNGIGDSYLFGRYCALDETKRVPQATLLFQIKIPSGRYQKTGPAKLGTDLMGASTGGGSYDMGAGVIFTKRLKPFLFHADVIYSFPQEARVDGVKTAYGRYLNYDLGAEYFLSKGFNLMAECSGFLQGDKRENNSRIPGSDVNYLTAAAGIGWSCPKIQALLAYQRTLIGQNTDANDSVIVTFIHTF